MTTDTASASALSAYAPLRRNSFLQRPTAEAASLSHRLSALTLGIALVVIRCWKDSRLWHEVMATTLPHRLQVVIRGHASKWRGTTAGLVTSLVRRLLRVLQEQLAPFVGGLNNNTNSTAIPQKLQGSQHQQQQPHHARTYSGDAPTSILCDLSSTQVTLLSDYYEDRVRQNQGLIRKVLEYWFGQHEPDVAQKKLWMIAASSTQYRQQVDAEIADLFLPLVCELATGAAAATTTAAAGGGGGTGASGVASDSTDGTVHPCRWKQWCADKEMYGYAGKVAAIVVLDQFSRHIRRHQEETQQHSLNSNNNSNGNTDQVGDNNSCFTLPPQATLDQLALRTAQLFTEGHAKDIQCGMIPVPQYIFGLMPYRHASTLESVTYVQQCVEHAANLNLQLEGMTSRFRKASNRRMAVLQDAARRTGEAATVELQKSNGDSNKSGDNKTKSEVAGGLSTLATSEDASSNEETITFSEEDILETFPFEPDMSDASDHAVVKTIAAFLADRGIYPSAPAVDALDNTSNNRRKNNKKSKGKQKGKKLQHQQQKPKPQSSTTSAPGTNTTTTNESATPCSLILSLSGGVDSMVIASALAYLKSSGGFAQLDIVAIHIDYANRPESKAESDYVQKYCGQHGIRFIVRRIDEITRGITARDEYEQRARQVRYDMYRTVAQDCAKKHEQSTVAVMLGHHRGDLRENVLSNAHKGCGPLDLSGMTAVSQNDGVTIYRPLLPLEKTDVYDYSNRYGVPYFKDTTPHWSTRGKLRNKLLPLLEEIYGEGSMNNLSTLATESDECRDLLHDALLKPFMDRVVRTPMGISFETAPFVAQAAGLFFWKFVLREVLHSAGLGMFSDKSVVSFLERIRPNQTYKKTIREGWLQCRRDYAVYLQADGKVFVFYPDSLPWRNSDAYKCAGQEIDITEQNTTAVGPWIVEAEVCDPVESEKEALIKKKAVSSMEKFMEGFVEYYVEVPTERVKKEDGPEDATPAYRPFPLVFISSFRKSNRPPAWKNTDEKIQETLPLLGLADDTFQDLKNPVDEKPVVVVRVTLDRRFSSD